MTLSGSTARDEERPGGESDGEERPNRGTEPGKTRGLGTRHDRERVLDLDRPTVGVHRTQREDNSAHPYCFPDRAQAYTPY